MKYLNTIVTTALVLATAALPALADPVFEDWNGTEYGGWQQNTSQTIVELMQFGGVDDSGYLHSSQTQSGFGIVGAANLSAPYTGNYATLGFSRVQCDLKFFAGAVQAVRFRVRYQNSSHGGWHVPLTDDFSAGDWRTCVVTFDPSWSDEDAIAAGWANDGSAPSFQETMSDVYYAEIRVSSSLDTEIGMDNFLLTDADATSVDPQTPLAVQLDSVHPNPFNPRTTVAFTVDRTRSVDVVVHDLRGAVVRRLVSSVLSAGDHEISWNGCDDGGRAVPSGTYMVRLAAGRNVQVSKMMLVR